MPPVRNSGNCADVELGVNDDNDDDGVQIYLHNVVSVGHKAYILRPFLCLTLVFSSAFYSLYRLSLNVNYWTDVAAGFALGCLLAVYLVYIVLQKYRSATMQFQ